MHCQAITSIADGVLALGERPQVFVMWDPTVVGGVAEIVERAGPVVFGARFDNSAHVNPTACFKREGVSSLIGKHARVNQDFFEIFGNFCIVPVINRRSSAGPERNKNFFSVGGAAHKLMDSVTFARITRKHA